MSDWEDLGTVWRSNEPPELGDLRRRLGRQGFWIRAWFAHEVALATATFALGAFFMLKYQLAMVGAALIAFGAFALAMSWRAWRGSFSIDTGTPGETIASALVRNAALQRYIVANYYVSIAATAMIGLVVATDALAESGDPARLHKALWAVTLSFGAMIVWIAGCGLYANRLHRERDRLVEIGRAIGVGEGRVY